MAVIGFLGDVQFVVSDRELRTISNFTWSGSARYAVHQRHNNHAATEFTGLDPDKITFDIILDSYYGVRPMDEIWRLFNYERSGAALPLTIGEHNYGFYRWNIVSHDTTVKSTDKNGNIQFAVVSLTLQEYLNT